MGSVPLLLHAAATASFVGCVFADNAGVVGGQRDGLAVLDGAVGGAMRMEACSFMGNTVDFAAVDASDLSSGRIFSDSTEVSARRRHVPTRPCLPLCRPVCQSTCGARPWTPACPYTHDEQQWGPPQSPDRSHHRACMGSSCAATERGVRKRHAQSPAATSVRSKQHSCSKPPARGCMYMQLEVVC